MAILKNENYRYLLTVLICFLPCFAIADDLEILGVLKDSYNISDANNYKLVIEKLQDACQVCESPSLKNRVQYRIGVLYFKSDDLKRAKEQFLQLIENGEISSEIQIAAINMSAQIARMQGRDDAALECYDKLIDKLLEVSQAADEGIAKSLFENMYIPSIYAKAEIYVFQKKYDRAAEVYNNAIQILKGSSVRDSIQYLPVLYDHLSQLQLKTGKVEDYFRSALTITNNYPSYERLSLIKLESFAVHFLEEKSIKQDYRTGSINAPAQLILHVKEKKSEPDITRIESFFNQISSQPLNKNYGEMLVKYHYAWFLDAIGKQDDASGLFGEIIDGFNENAGDPDYLCRVVLQYSKLQKAIIDGEYERYQEAFECINSIENDMMGTHISTLSDSIRNSLETLKREVPKNEDTN